MCNALNSTPSMLTAYAAVLGCLLFWHSSVLANDLRECYACSSENLSLRPEVADIVPPFSKDCFEPHNNAVPITPCTTACYYATGPLFTGPNRTRETAVIRGCWLDLYGAELPWMFGKKDRCGQCSEMLNADKCLISATRDTPRTGQDEICICWEARCNQVPGPAKLVAPSEQTRSGARTHRLTALFTLCLCMLLL